MPFNSHCPGCGSIDPCGCGSTKSTPSSDIKYVGPNLPGTGIETCDSLTVALQKIDAEILAIKQAIAPTTSTTTSSSSTTTTTTSTIAPEPPQFRLTFETIQDADLLVGDSSNVNDWNTFLNLPTNGNPYTNVQISGTTVILTGGSNVTIGTYVFDEVDTLLKVEDNGTVVEVATNGFYYCWRIIEMSLLSVTAVGDLAFELCEDLQIINLPACQNLGTTVGDDGVFDQIDQNANITLTIPSELMTINSGNPDGDIQYLQANNTVTVVTT